MDNAMVKRGIGAIVLAIIAALLLGFLLKDKSQERQEIVDMKLPGAPEMNIPSLTGTDDSSTSMTTLINETVSNASESVKNTTSDVIASVTGTASKVKDAVTNNTTEDVAKKAVNTAKPGFAIRPPSTNEQREVVDTRETASPTSTPQEVATTETNSTTNNTIVASTAQTPKKQDFTPRIVEEKKKTVKKKVVTATKKENSTPKKAKTSAVSTPTATAGKYSIQLLATSSQSRANKLAKTMKGEGYKSFITQTIKKDKILYRVRLGAHTSRSSALKAQKGLKRRYQKNFFVQNSLVVTN